MLKLWLYDIENGRKVTSTPNDLVWPFATNTKIALAWHYMYSYLWNHVCMSIEEFLSILFGLWLNTDIMELYTPSTSSSSSNSQYHIQVKRSWKSYGTSPKGIKLYVELVFFVCGKWFHFVVPCAHTYTHTHKNA